MNEFKSVTLSRKDLQLILDSFDENTEFVHFGLELDSIEGDKILWVDNGEFGEKRKFIIINPSTYKGKK